MAGDGCRVSHAGRALHVASWSYYTHTVTTVVSAAHRVVEYKPPVHQCALSSAPDAVQNETRKAWRIAALLIVSAAITRAIVSALVPLLPDEAYYWEWSRHLQAGYFDHPPAIALLIAAGTSLFGDTRLGVRVGPAVAAVLVHASIVILSARLGGSRAAVRAAVLVAVLPFSVLGLTLATPDAPLLASASLALVFLERALSSPLKSAQSLRWWALTGVMLGLAFISKFTAILLPFALVIACLVYAPLRARFTEPGPWVASAIALVIFSPVVAWNASANWIAFRFQLNHGFTASVRGTPLGRELELIGGQLGLITPIIGVLVALAVAAALRNEWHQRTSASVTGKSAVRFAFAVIAVMPFGLFAVSAWKHRIEPNWPALAYSSALVLLASSRAQWAGAQWWRGGIALAATVLVAAFAQIWRPLAAVPPARDPIARAHGWSTLAAAISTARRNAFVSGAPAQWVAAERYQDASQIAFNLPDHPTVFSLNLGGRANQYDLWQGPEDVMRDGDALVAAFDATAAGDSLADVVSKWFGATQRGQTVQLRRAGGIITERRIWLYRDAHLAPMRTTLMLPR